jgi:hypothetical protein
MCKKITYLVEIGSLAGIESICIHTISNMSETFTIAFMTTSRDRCVMITYRVHSTGDEPPSMEQTYRKSLLEPGW